jgi:hemoglobin-like flavoprotein
MTSDSAAGALPPDPELIQVIRRSVAWLGHLQDAFIQQLRADLVSMIPDIYADGWVFSERMVQAVLWAATTDQPQEEIAAGLRWVGAMNRLDGFAEDQYRSVAHALVRTVHVLSESHWSTATGSAWSSYFLWMQPHLIAGAQQAAARQRAARWQAAAEFAAAAARGEEPSVTAGDVDMKSVRGLLDDEDDEDDEDAGYGQIMLSMTLDKRRDRRPQ